MKLPLIFKDATMPKKLNLETPKYFFPDERDLMKNEAARILRERGIVRKFELVKER